MSKTHSTIQKAPSISTTGLGYRFVRDESGGSYDMAYIHQLAAIAGGADPHKVFGDAYDTHHLPVSDWLDLDGHTPPTPIRDEELTVPALDVPRAVEIQPRWDHREQNLVRGEADD